MSVHGTPVRRQEGSRRIQRPAGSASVRSAPSRLHPASGRVVCAARQPGGRSSVLRLTAGDLLLISRLPNGQSGCARSDHVLTPIPRQHCGLRIGQLSNGAVFGHADRACLPPVRAGAAFSRFLPHAPRPDPGTGFLESPVEWSVAALSRVEERHAPTAIRAEAPADTPPEFPFGVPAARWEDRRILATLPCDPRSAGHPDPPCHEPSSSAERLTKPSPRGQRGGSRG